MSKVVAVTFNSRDGYMGSSSSSKRYHYRSDIDGLEVGDTCTVQSPSGLAFVTVQDLDPSPSAYRGATKWLIGKVDLAAQAERERRDALLAAAKERQAEARAEFHAAVGRIRERAEMALFALRYPELGPLYREVQGLDAAVADLS